MSHAPGESGLGGEVTPGARESLDREVIVLTPESTALRLTLAGPGSRFAAALIDAGWQTLGLLAVALVAAAPAVAGLGWAGLPALAARWVWPLAIGAAWLVLWVYPVWFEVRWRGQTPGKRALGLRVVEESGRPVDLPAAALRNALRLVDLLPLVPPYVCGAVALLSGARCQRLGDQVAGTLVIRERPTPWLDRLVADDLPPTAVCPVPVARLDRLTPAQMQVVAHYRQRRDGLPLATRRELARRVAAPLRQALAARPEPAIDDETWLEAVYEAWSARRRRW